VIAQVVLVAAGGVAAQRAADRALDDTFVFLADISQERVLTYSRAAQRAVVETGRQISGIESSPAAALEQLHTELVNSSEVGALAITYADGDYIALRRLDAPEGGFAAYII